MKQAFFDDGLHQDQQVIDSNQKQESTSSTPKLDTGLACLVMMARLHGVAADTDQLAHESAMNGSYLGITELLLATKRLGLHAKVVKV